jgi:hypothetical protein
VTALGLSRAEAVSAYTRSVSRATAIGPNKASDKSTDGKPLVYDELVARMRAVLRRSNGIPV